MSVVRSLLPLSLYVHENTRENCGAVFVGAQSFCSRRSASQTQPSHQDRLYSINDTNCVHLLLLSTLLLSLQTVTKNIYHYITNKIHYLKYAYLDTHLYKAVLEK